MHRNRNLTVFSCLLLVALLIPLLFMVSHDLHKWKIKTQSRARLEKSRTLIQLRLHKDEVKWMDKKEILVNGRMFDYKEVSMVDDWYTFTGHYDDKEGKWLRKLQQAQEQKKDQQTLLQVFKSLLQLYHESGEASASSASPLFSHPFLRNASLLTVSLDISTPPPQANSQPTV